jgi:hypothetical protein
VKRRIPEHKLPASMQLVKQKAWAKQQKRKEKLKKVAAEKAAQKKEEDAYESQSEGSAGGAPPLCHTGAAPALRAYHMCARCLWLRRTVNVLQQLELSCSLMCALLRCVPRLPATGSTVPTLAHFVD